jgi:hypothetical protein
MTQKNRYFPPLGSGAPNHPVASLKLDPKSSRRPQLARQFASRPRHSSLDMTHPSRLAGSRIHGWHGQVLAFLDLG